MPEEKNSEEKSEKAPENQPISAKSMEILIAQLIPTSRYFEVRFDHMQDQINDIKSDLKEFRGDVDRRFSEMRADMDYRFEKVDKRFEQVDKRFDQVDKRFEQIIASIDRLG
jgi:hypothetical protein